MSFIERIQQKPEGHRRFLMLLSMVVLSFFVLAIAWKSFERNLGVRLGSAPTGEEVSDSRGFLQALKEEVQKVSGGAPPREQPRTDDEQTQTADAHSTTLGKIFSIAREIRRVVKYNAGEIAVWAHGAGGWFWEQLR